MVIIIYTVFLFGLPHKDDYERNTDTHLTLSNIDFAVCTTRKLCSFLQQILLDNCPYGLVSDNISFVGQNPKTPLERFFDKVGVNT